MAAGGIKPAVVVGADIIADDFLVVHGRQVDHRGIGREHQFAAPYQGRQLQDVAGGRRGHHVGMAGAVHDFGRARLRARCGDHQQRMARVARRQSRAAVLGIGHADRALRIAALEIEAKQAFMALQQGVAGGVDLCRVRVHAEQFVAHVDIAQAKLPERGEETMQDVAAAVARHRVVEHAQFGRRAAVLGNGEARQIARAQPFDA